MTHLAKELDNRREGDRSSCPICRKARGDVISCDRVWTWSLAHPGESPWRPRPPTRPPT